MGQCPRALAFVAAAPVRPVGHAKIAAAFARTWKEATDDLQSDQSRIRRWPADTAEIYPLRREPVPAAEVDGDARGNAELRVDRRGSRCGERFVPPLLDHQHSRQLDRASASGRYRTRTWDQVHQKRFRKRPFTTGRSRLPEQACTVTGSGLPPSTRPIFRSPTTWARQKPGRGPASISSARRRSSAHTKGRCKHFQKRCV